jgi:hypothetical protein
MISRLRQLPIVLLVLSGGLLWLAHPTPAYADTYTVTNTNDSGPGSLRQAMLDANAHLNGSELDIVAFAIPPAQCTTLGNVCTILPTSALPTITDPVTLDGWSQGGSEYRGSPLIELSGTNAGAPVDGLTISSGNTFVRGLAINRFVGSGILATGPGQNTLYGNYIGTDASGTIARGNLFAGIAISGGSETRIGAAIYAPPGAPSPPPTIVSGNGVGITIANGANFTAVVNTRIGTDISGTLPLGNSSNGILISDSFRSQIGFYIFLGFFPGDNIIAFNGSAGVAVRSGSDNAIVNNRFFQNGRLGIDLDEVGVTPNDALDADGGANDRQNFPVLTSVRTNQNGTRITGVLESAPNTRFDLQFYVSPACDPSGYGQGQDPIRGSDGASLWATVRTDAQGTAGFSVLVPAVALGQGVAATASKELVPVNTTGSEVPGPTSTSEFSACRVVTAPGISIGQTGPLVTTEAGGSSTFSIVLNDRPTADVTIPLGSSNTREGTVAPASLTFTPANWNTPRTVTVTGVDDQIADGNVAYTVRIRPVTSADPGYNGLDPFDPVVSNTDDEGTPALSIADLSLVEGNAGTTSATFAVSLAPASTQAITVRYATADDTATAPGDYTAASGTLTFGPGETSKTVAVPVVGDATVEPDEAFVVNLSTPTNATIGRGQARGTIRNDDAQAAAQPCSPRPSPRIESRQVGPGRLQVTVTTQTTPLLPANTLQRLDFGAADNARVEIPGAAPGTPGGPSSTPGGPAGTPGNFSLTPPAGVSSATFFVQRQQPGPFKVAYVVVDACHASAGSFNTFVGGGSGVQ